MKQYELLFEELIEKIKLYHPTKDFSMLEKAYTVAKEAHGDQVRKSGEPYIIHPLSVSIILAELELDIESMVAGILHDVVEDTKYSSEDIAEMFSEEISLLVEGVTKLEKIKYSSKEELQAENYRKMFLAMAKDIRVIIIKIADRLHNMRTLKYMRPEKQKEIAQETLSIYAPLADRLGISKIKTELEDLSLRYLEPDAYYDLAEKIERKQTEREEYVQNIVSEIQGKLNDEDIKCDVYGRPKHFFSIYKKMLNQNKTLDQIFDLFAVRVLVGNVGECYRVLGEVHEMYTPVPNRFKDYIAVPKANNYQSLHNTLIGPEGIPFEIQIRTRQMHKVAEYGIAAHWKYKEGKTGTESELEEEKMSWLGQILEWQKDMADNKEFMETIKTDLDVFNDSVYCFTPRGQIITMPAGSTPVDFAYYIHSAVGNRMIGARVNGKIVTFEYKIENGDIVEIVTSQSSRGPSMDWLKFVKSSQARSKINQWFKKINKVENITYGKDLLEKEAKKRGYNLSEILNPKRIEEILDRYSFRDWDSICAAIGHGGLKEGQIINRVLEEFKKELDKKSAHDNATQKIEEYIEHQDPKHVHRAKSGVYIKGVGDIDVRFSKCCSPIPGDEIVGFVTRGRGVSVHRTDCINIINLSEEEKGRLLDAQWNIENKPTEKGFLVEIRIISFDRLGLLNEVTAIAVEEKVLIENLNARSNKGEAIVDLAIIVDNKNQLSSISKKIYNLEGVKEIQRVNT